MKQSISRPRRLERMCWIITLLAITNWLACAAACQAIGGDGWQGYFEHGRYFVGSHGAYTEVSQTAFIYTKLHVAVSVVLLSLGGCAGIIAALLRDHRRMKQGPLPIERPRK